jgi:hypothetical protein
MTAPLTPEQEAEHVAGLERLVHMDLLPDSRLSGQGPTVKRSVWRGNGWWQPIYCANCGKEGGLVPEENMTTVLWLCDICAETHGAIEGAVCVPDAVFYAKVELEQREKYGRLLTEQELVDVVAADASPLATLIKQGR